jgi:UDP-N-acetylglucosamine 1-carboxyvinyltransferase
LENVPRLETVFVDLEILRSIGGKADWIGNNKLLLNGSGLNSYKISADMGSRYRSTFLLAGPLLYRFGKAEIPKIKTTNFKPSPINRIIDTWRSLGYSVTEDEEYLKISAETPQGCDISFPSSTHTGTDNAILSSIALKGTTIINNASEEPEVEDLIEFCKIMGADIEKIGPKKIKVTGVSHFRGGGFEVMPDKFEAALFATGALVTGGNVIIQKINKLHLMSFVSFISNLGAHYEFSQNELKVWRGSTNLTSTNVMVSPSPGFVPDWQSLATLVLTQATGVGTVHDSVYLDRFEYTKDLNRMGADIELVQPSSIGTIPIISDDSYAFEKLGEPFSVAKIQGPTKLKGSKIHIIDYRFLNTIVMGCVAAEGKSEIHGFKPMHEATESYFEKLISLGAKIKL